MRRHAMWIIAGLVIAVLAATQFWPVDNPKTEVNVGNARLVFPLIPEEDLPNAIRFAPIGYFRTPFTPDTGAPRQASLSPETECDRAGFRVRRGRAGRVQGSGRLDSG